MADSPWYVRAASAAGETARAFRAAFEQSNPQKAAPGPSYMDPDEPNELSEANLQGFPNRGQSTSGGTVAPYPLVDKYPSVLGGSNLSLETISSFSRLCTTGYRREWVDMLSEQVEREPHGYAVLAKRIFVVAGARIEVTPPDEAPDGQKEVAAEIAKFVERVLLNIPELTTALGQINWALYYGAGSSEVGYVRDADKWIPKSLSFVHSRRIAWPDPMTWEAHIWDQGAVRGYMPGVREPTVGPNFGLRISDYPGKFLLHTPRLRGEYPTREGLGRILCWWFAMKGMGARVGGQYVERFSRPWPFFYYSTQTDGLPRRATKEDIKDANNAAGALGTGSLTAAVLPNSIKAELQGPGVATAAGSALTPTTWIEFINGEISKAVLGETLTTESGKNGNRAAAEVHKQGSMELARYDARMLADMLVRDLIVPLVALNFPDQMALIPRCKIIVEEKPDPSVIMDLIERGAKVGLPINADGAAQMMGIPLIEQERPEGAKGDWKPKPRRTAPLALVDFHELDPDAPPPMPKDQMLDIQKRLNGLTKQNGQNGAPAPPNA